MIGHGAMALDGRFRLDVKKNFTQRVVKNEQVVQRDCACTSLKGQVGCGPDEPHPSEWHPCPWQRHWDFMILKVPSNPNHSIIL